MTNATNKVARVAAAVAGLGLVAMSFAPLAGAQTATTTTTTTTTSASVMFSRDLHTGSTGADVTALQTWLIGKGFSIPAGATGYFGMQTKAAVAAFQAANGISPAAGYFGPITRAKVNAMGGSTTSTGLPAGCTSTAGFSPTTGASCAGGSSTTTTTSGGLSGNEASFRNFTLQSGNSLSQGDSNIEIGIAKFDVVGGDVNLQRVTVELQSNLGGVVNQHPWSYIQTLSVYNGSTKIGSIDVSSKSAWSQETAASGADFSSGNVFYSVDVPVNSIIRQGNNNQLSIRADAQNTIDTANNNQTFNMIVPTNGIRAVDAKGIQEYTGSNGAVVTLSFNTAQNGKLNLTTSANNPKSGVLVASDVNTSSKFDVLAFDLKNSQNTKVDFNTLTFQVTSASSTLRNIVRTATLKLGSDTYTGTLGTGSTTTIVFSNLSTSMAGNATISGVLTVDLLSQPNHFATTGEKLTFSLAAAGIDASNSNTGNASVVNGSAQGKIQSIGVNSGITVAGNSNSTSESFNSTTPSLSTGNFVLKFDVTANGDNNVYVPKTIAALSSTTAPSDTTSGVVVITDLAGSTTSATSVSSSLNSTAMTDPDNSGYYMVRSGTTETFTANVTIDPNTAGYYQVGLDRVRFTTVSTGGSLQTLDTDQTDAAFQTQQQYIH